MLRREEAQYGDRLTRLPICHTPKTANRQPSARKRVAAAH